MTRRRWAIVGVVVAGFAALGLWARSATAKDTEPAARYFHAAHAKLKINQNECRQCHVLDDRYNVLPATLGKNHQPCNNPECHANDFFSKDPKICVVCHDDIDPNVKQQPIVRQRRDSEFGGDLSHKSHVKLVKATGDGKNGTCVTCHGDVFAGKRAVSSGHGSCSSCHGRTTQPAMSECGACHALGQAKPKQGGASGDWAVSGMFEHKTHEKDPRSSRSETICTECHGAISDATKLAEIKNPTMQSCDGCHNGKIAFKTTGFACYNCHGSPGKASGGP